MCWAMCSRQVPLLLHLTAPQVVLVDLPAELEFLILVAAYKNSQKPGFVPPNIGNREIDLYTVRTRGMQRSTQDSIELSGPPACSVDMGMLSATGLDLQAAQCFLSDHRSR